jgi:hypothetical protein
MQGTAATEADWTSIMDRCICHLAVDLIPDVGLGDLKQQLLDAVTFYSHESLPAIPQIPEPRPALVANRYNREPLIIDED